MNEGILGLGKGGRERGGTAFIPVLYEGHRGGRCRKGIWVKRKRIREKGKGLSNSKNQKRDMGKIMGEQKCRTILPENGNKSSEPRVGGKRGNHTKRRKKGRLPLTRKQMKVIKKG